MVLLWNGTSVKTFVAYEHMGKRYSVEYLKHMGFCLYFFQMFEKGEQRVPVYNRDYECTILFEQKMYL